jgi:hypothetical protein
MAADNNRQPSKERMTMKMGAPLAVVLLTTVYAVGSRMRRTATT